MPENPLVLVVEDSEGDALLARRAFQRLGARNRIHVVTNGEEAINYLSADGKYADRTLYPLPGLVLLDLKLPLRDGFEVLNWIRNRPALVGLPVVVMTMSERDQDRERAYSSGANSFVVKPMELENFTAAIDTFKRFWLDLARTPVLS